MLTETIGFLVAWTPFLLQGFLWNIFIAISAVILGTFLGVGLAWVRIKKTGRPAAVAEQISKLMRGVPTLALIFYAVFVLPSEFSLPGTELVIHVPQWTKAVSAATGKKGRALFHPLRLALTGREQGPELKALLPLIGRARALRRLEAAGG